MTKAVAVAVDRDLCLGSGYCAASISSVFSQDDTGIVVLNRHNGESSTGPVVVSAALREEVTTAAFRCPAGAIDVADIAAPDSSDID